MSVAVAAIFKNEGPYVLEWVAYYQALGAKAIIIADNESDDGTSELLTALDRGEWITRVPFPTSGQPPQMAAFAHILKEYGNVAEWFAFVDADEFIVPSKEGGNLDSIVASLGKSDVGAIMGNWATYGSSGLLDRSDELVIERLTGRGSINWGVNRHTKPILRPSAVDQFLSPHFAVLKNGFRTVQSDGSAFVSAQPGLADKIIWGEFRVNHYVIKSLAEFKKKKARGRAMIIGQQREEEFFSQHDNNEVNEAFSSLLLAETKRNMSEMAFQLGEIGGWNPHPLAKVSVR